MHRLNLHYLRCFWAVAREGGLAGASGALNLTPSTLSAQVRALEQDLGLKLFVRAGRKLQLTDAGHMVLRYADDLFALADELVGAARGREAALEGPRNLRIGVSQAMTRLVAYQFLEPAYRLGTAVHLVCSEDHTAPLLERLIAGELDVVLTDEPVPPGSRAHGHPLGSSGVSLFGAPALAKECRRGFPRSLDGCPVLLPAEGMLLRRALDDWFGRQRIRPKVMGEFDDSALMKVFGQRGVGLFAAPSIVADAILRQYDVDVVAEVPSLKEHYYALTAERKIANPLVTAICRAARAGRR